MLRSGSWGRAGKRRGFRTGGRPAALSSCVPRVPSGRPALSEPRPARAAGPGGCARARRTPSGSLYSLEPSRAAARAAGRRRTRARTKLPNSGRGVIPSRRGGRPLEESLSMRVRRIARLRTCPSPFCRSGASLALASAAPWGRGSLGIAVPRRPAPRTPTLCHARPTLFSRSTAGPGTPGFPVVPGGQAACAGQEPPRSRRIPLQPNKHRRLMSAPRGGEKYHGTE